MSEGSRITTEGRAKLEEVIPLDTPYLVFIDPSNICNQECQFCPTGNRKLMKELKVEQTLMDFNLYRHIIDQFKKFPRKVKTLRLYKMGEPLLNSRFTDMVLYAKESNCFGSIDTTTNGKLIDSKMARLLVYCGIDRINISVPADYDLRYIDQINYLYATKRDSKPHIFVKLAADGKSEEEIAKFKEKFSPISDSLALEHTAPCWPGYNVEGINKKVGIYGQPVQPDILVCPYVFYAMTINSNGTVDHCFVDWKQDFILGDLTKGDDVVKVWDSSSYNFIRLSMLWGHRNVLRNCGVCEHHMYGQPDNIDKYVSILSDRLLAKGW